MAEEPKRVELSASELESISADLMIKWQTMEAYADKLEKRTSSLEADLTSARASEDKLRGQLSEATHRDRVYSRRLAHKDHEIQELLAQIAELKNSSAPGPAGLRAALLDPAVNLVIARLRAEVVSHKTRLEETQSELSAWKFTPDSNTGKRLMAKCRLLYQENEELGRVVSSGRLAKLEGDLALQKRFSEEVKKSQSELDEFLQDLDEDVEGMQGTIYFLQQELRKIKEVERTDNQVQNGECERTRMDGVVDDVHRTLSDEGEGEGEGAPVTKKPRRDSEYQLHQPQLQLGLTNGDVKEEEAS